jgi:tRNA A37 N6-isopentenylltransferase MiaA
VWALWQGDVVASDDVRWLMPIPWVAAGVVGLVASAITGSRRYSKRQTGWVTSEQTATGYDEQREEQP